MYVTLFAVIHEPFAATFNPRFTICACSQSIMYSRMCRSIFVAIPPLAAHIQTNPTLRACVPASPDVRTNPRPHSTIAKLGCKHSRMLQPSRGEMMERLPGDPAAVPCSVPLHDPGHASLSYHGNAAHGKAQLYCITILFRL